MQTLIRQIINITSSDLEASKRFYTTLFDFEIAFDSDWFINLVSANKGVELGIIERTNEVVPKQVSNTPQGVYVTLVVKDVDLLYETVQDAGYEILEKPRDTFYGQRQLVIRDPNGLVVDVSAPIPNFQFGR